MPSVIAVHQRSGPIDQTLAGDGQGPIACLAEYIARPDNGVVASFFDLHIDRGARLRCACQHGQVVIGDAVLLVQARVVGHIVFQTACGWGDSFGVNRYWQAGYCCVVVECRVFELRNVHRNGRGRVFFCSRLERDAVDHLVQVVEGACQIAFQRAAAAANGDVIFDE